jgi:hypothetical protein
MERRRQIRNQPSEAIEVAVLGEGHSCMIGRILDESDHGFALLLPASVPPGTPIKIEAQDSLVLGEVSYCTHQESGFRVGLVVKHRLAGLADLHRLNRALHSNELPASPNIFELTEVSSIMEK